MTDDQYKQLRVLTRQHTYLIWQMAKAGAPLEGEDAAQAQAMLDHPEYHDYWDRVPDMGDEEVLVDGVNPFAHIVSHVAVENQIAADDPRAVADALHRLMGQGMSRHDAVHRIGAIFAGELYKCLKEQCPFDNDAYSRAVRRLGRARPSTARRVKRSKKRRR